MKDILKSAFMGIILVGTLIFSAPILNEDEKQEIVSVAEQAQVETERDIHIPL